MANKLYEETDIQAIANAIRSKGINGVFKVSEMANAIMQLSPPTPVYTNIWKAPYKLNARLNTSETDPAYNGSFISAWYDVQDVDFTKDVTLRSNMNLFNYTGMTSGGEYFRGYNSMTAGDKVPMVLVTINYNDYFTRTFENGIYSLTVHPIYWTGTLPKYIRWCAQVSSSAIASSFFDDCILTINEEI